MYMMFACCKRFCFFQFFLQVHAISQHLLLCRLERQCLYTQPAGSYTWIKGPEVINEVAHTVSSTRLLA